MKPTEGTILTVNGEAAQAARNEANEGGSVVTVMDKASEAAKLR